MGDQYIKRSGAWTKVSRPYVRRGGIWTPVQESWVKRSGAWVQSYQYDNTPPQIPELQLQIIDGRYIHVSARLPSASHDPTLKKIRILVSNTASPTSQFGSGFISTNADSYPGEDWSDWWYNGAIKTSDHGDSSVFDTKSYPVNPTSKTNLPGGRYYYFSAWSVDMEDNWSAGIYAQIWMPKDGVKPDNVLVKEANIQAQNVGSIDASNTYTEGRAKAHNSPRSNGVFYHGNQFNFNVGKSGTPTVSSARIRVSRANDAGQPQANVTVGRHGKLLGAPITSSDFFEVTTIGTIQKGETKWLDLPTSWYPNFKDTLLGIGLKFGTSATDEIELNDLGADLRCGEVHLVWTEAL